MGRYLVGVVGRGWLVVALLGPLASSTPAPAQVLLVSLDRDTVVPNSTVNLGAVVRGVPKEITLTLRNVRVGQSGTLRVTNVGLSGAAATDYDVLTLVPINIPADRTAPVRVRLTATAAGQRRATLAVKSTGQPNPYELDLLATASDALTCDGRLVAVERDLVPGTAVSGTTTLVREQITDRGLGFRFQVGRTAKYRFSLCEGQDVTPNMSLCLFDIAGSALAQDDGSCVAGGEIVRNLDPGAYVLAVSGTPNGMFRLRYGLTPLCDGRVVDSPSGGVLIGVKPTIFTGSISEALASGRRFAFNEARRCVFSLCREGGTASFDSRLCLFDAEGKLVAENNDHCGTRSEIDQTLEPGSYIIAVSGVAGAGGSFSLAAFIVPECAGTAVKLAGEIPFSALPRVLRGSLALGEAHGYLFDAGPFDFAEFSFCGNGGSAAFDSTLCVFAPAGGLLGQNDDFCGVNARVRVPLGSSASHMVVIAGRNGGGEYSLSHLGVASCGFSRDDFFLRGDLTPTLEPQSVQGTVTGDREDVLFIRVQADGVYAFTFCEPPGTFAGSSSRLCLLDAAGGVVQERQPCLQGGAFDPGEIRTQLAAGEYALSITETFSGDTSRAYTLVYYAESIAPGPFRPCDFDCSGELSITDPIAILGFLFLGDDPACCPPVADCNSSGGVEISDAVFALSFLFSGGAAPNFFPGCGGSGCVGYPCEG